jgi:hypothetical protein
VQLCAQVADLVLVPLAYLAVLRLELVEGLADNIEFVYLRRDWRRVQKSQVESAKGDRRINEITSQKSKPRRPGIRIRDRNQLKWRDAGE